MLDMRNLYCTLVSMSCEQLTDLELAAINDAAQAGFDPRPVRGYEKIKHLFTESEGLKMHSDGLDALAGVVLQRLEGEVT